MSVAWTLLYAGTEKSLADWGIAGLRRTLVSQGVDTVRFAVPGRNVDQPALFALDSTAVVKRDGIRWFEGRFVLPRDTADGAAEDQTYEMHGASWYLENLVHQQEWTYITGFDPDGLPVTATMNVSRLYLFRLMNGTKQNTGAQITEALDWAIARGAPIQAGSVTPAVNAPSEEVADIMCAEVIRKSLRWSPDAATWWDYSTSPPTFQCRRRADMAIATLALTGTDRIEIAPVPDRQLAAVVIKYLVTLTSSFSFGMTVIEDKYPAAATGLDFRTLVATIDLQGPSASYTIITQDVVTEAIDINSTAWWQSHVPWLADASLDPLTITIISPARDPSLHGYPRELVAGAMSDWMPVSFEEEVVTAQVHYNTDNGNKHRYVPIEARITATNATTRTYSARSSGSIDPGEAVPTGVAQALYESASTLEYQGAITIVSEDCASTIRPGMRLNVTGGKTAWATMNAIVQQVDEEISTGTTTITIGPPSHLGLTDLIELTRVNRARMVTNWALRNSGTNAGAEIEQPRKTHQRAPSTGPHNYMVQVIEDAAAGRSITHDGEVAKTTITDGLATITLDLLAKVMSVSDGTKTITIALAGLGAQTAAEFREYSYCENGVQRKVRLLGTPVYD